MIKLMSPPGMAKHVLHLNCPSRSVGGKDYVLVKMFDGRLWVCYGPANQVRNCSGRIQDPIRTWQALVDEKTRKGYTVVGEYFNHVGTGGSGVWNSSMTYAHVQNIPIQPPQTTQPQPPHTAVQPKQPTEMSLADRYPLSRRVKEMWGNCKGGSDWFLAIH